MKRVRDSKQSRQDILNAAENEFSEKGFYGTRIDEIAQKAGINKRMIYQYFNNKEDLYKAVLVQVYGRLSDSETQIFGSDKSAVDSLKEIIELYMDFLRDNPNYVSMIMWENLNKGKYISEIDIKGMKDHTFVMLRQAIEKGQKEGTFKEDIDVDQIIYSILTSTFSSFSNKYTLKDMIDFDYDSDDVFAARKQTIIDMLLEYIYKK